MYNTNNNGPIIEPCGIPDVTSKGDDTLPCIIDDADLANNFNTLQ